MPQLSNFNDDQRQLLIALPYRVGLWVSSSDSSGGNEADEAEMTALTTIVTGFAEDFLKSEFVQRLMEETVAHRADWDKWVENIDEVPAECTRAVDMLSEILDRKELASFKFTMMEIANSVAMAYREAGEENGLGFRLQVYSRLLMEKLQAMLGKRKARTVDELLNISESEQAAIDRLARALEIGKTRTPPATSTVVA
jgi:hypothetical protein